MKILDVILKDDDLFYVGSALECHERAWSLEGIYSSFELACLNADDDEFIVRCPKDLKLPKEIGCLPQSWWKINGKIERSGVFKS